MLSHIAPVIAAISERVARSLVAFSKAVCASAQFFVGRQLGRCSSCVGDPRLVHCFSQSENGSGLLLSCQVRTQEWLKDRRGWLYTRLITGTERNPSRGEG